MYRILAATQEVRERRDQLRHPAYQKPGLLAQTPNEVWSWDITKLMGRAKWTCRYNHSHGNRRKGCTGRLHAPSVQLVDFPQRDALRQTGVDMVHVPYRGDPPAVCTENPGIVVIESAEERERFDASGPLNRASNRCILVQRPTRSDAQL
jgi:hypothetical protein